MASLPTLSGRAESYETYVNGNAVTCCEPFPGEADVYPGVARLPRISLTWHDPHHRISSKLESMFREVKDIFRRVGVDAVMRFPGEHTKSAGKTIALRVVLIPHLASDWGLSSYVMGMVPTTQAQPQTVFVFFPGVGRALGHHHVYERSSRPKKNSQMRRALARVIAHEIVHALAPAHPHAAGGLMSGKQTRATLLMRRTTLDAACGRALLTALELRGKGTR